MAQIPNGIIGEFIGTAGNITGYVRNGKNIIRTRRSKSHKAMTTNRMAQQQKIKVCTEFTKAFSGTGFFSKSFPSFGIGGTGYNRATSAIMNRAITGAYPNTTIDYSLVQISGGQLPVAENAAATVNAQHQIIFSWTDNSGTGTAKSTDIVILVAYFPSVKQIIYSLNAGTRADCNAVLDTHVMQGDEAETWIGFISAGEEDASNSVYTEKHLV